MQPQERKLASWAQIDPANIVDGADAKQQDGLVLVKIRRSRAPLSSPVSTPSVAASQRDDHPVGRPGSSDRQLGRGIF
jgi:hypothetical protein